jgi:hypothetical protein
MRATTSGSGKMQVFSGSAIDAGAERDEMDRCCVRCATLRRKRTERQCAGKQIPPAGARGMGASVRLFPVTCIASPTAKSSRSMVPNRVAAHGIAGAEHEAHGAITKMDRTERVGIRFHFLCGRVFSLSTLRFGTAGTWGESETEASSKILASY